MNAEVYSEPCQTSKIELFVFLCFLYLGPKSMPSETAPVRGFVISFLSSIAEASNIKEAK